MAMLTLPAVLKEIKENPGKPYVYVMRCPDGLPFYVGVGTNRRIMMHALDASSGRKGRKFSLLRKYEGRETYEIVGWFSDWASAAKLECELISRYGRHDLGLGYLANLTDGGEGCTNRIISKSFREKCRLSRLGKPMSEATRAKIGAIHRGKILSTETRQRMSDAKKGIRPVGLSAAHAANLGRVFTSEHKKKLSAAKAGRRLSVEHKKRISDGLRKYRDSK